MRHPGATPEEAAAYLNDAMALALTAGDGSRLGGVVRRVPEPLLGTDTRRAPWEQRRRRRRSSR